MSTASSSAARTWDDPELVAAIRGAHPEAPFVLWKRLAPMVFRILRQMVGPDHLVEDLAQEVFLCVFRKLPLLREPRALKSFVASTTVFTARWELRRRRTRLGAAHAVDEAALEYDTTPRHVDAREALHRFLGALDRLDKRDRDAFVLRFIEALDLAEVASALRVSLATTKRRIARSWSRVARLAQRDPFLAEYVGATRPSVPRRPKRALAARPSITR